MGKMSFKNRTSIVTGSAMGIGKGIAQKLASLGSNLILFDISDKIFETAKEIEHLEVEVLPFKGDVTNKEDVERSVEEGISKFGKIDILVNNAGIYPSKPFIEMTESDWDRVLNINLKSMFLFSKAVLPNMMKNSYGRIVNISSIAAIVGFPGLIHYSASKGGVVGFTKALALEVAKFGITVNAIAPGPIETSGTKVDEQTAEIYKRLIPVGRMGKPEDIANAVAFLASEESQFITGHLLVVDGGYTIQ
ncbi:3-oxoacyl-[acyl-carrier-protein] reductase FabG (short chain dehydrogenase SDR family) [Fervidicoccus fontis Kam940]|uniref:3-oxoacyl-[acyl-carrier-protein] reductase FabG (Short chain dehydrogenase SDR family) n=2 Tax=Fervidicoccus fontis TaxID=683846 RepID=I0A246_FERFK|nr:3-oxoacyl-[acyl-carrier-protein] reductase FabG (short chain dehydrogenase SDR family) [Fervidicoccus fontis Kam940]